MTRHALEREWLELTRTTLPALAAAKDWPVSEDHCFQRILLDNAFGGVWYDFVDRRPAYVHAPTRALERAVQLGRQAVQGMVSLHALNEKSLNWRSRRRKEKCAN